MGWLPVMAGRLQVLIEWLRVAVEGWLPVAVGRWLQVAPPSPEQPPGRHRLAAGVAN